MQDVGTSNLLYPLFSWAVCCLLCAQSSLNVIRAQAHSCFGFEWEHLDNTAGLGNALMGNTDNYSYGH